jgi:hypothetical protein
MCAPLTDYCVSLRKKTGSHRSMNFVVPVNCFTLFIWKSRPVRNPFFKTMCQIDQFYWQLKFFVCFRIYEQEGNNFE